MWGWGWGLVKLKRRFKKGDRVEIKGQSDLYQATLLEPMQDGWRVSPDHFHWRGIHLVSADQILRKIPTKVEREIGPTVYYRQQGADGKSAGSLHHRQVQALVAVRAGLCKARYRRTQSPWFCDYHLEPESSVYGIGRGSLSDLQRYGYIEERQDEGPLTLTAKGDRVLAEILDLDGAHLPPMVTEVAA